MWQIELKKSHKNKQYIKKTRILKADYSTSVPVCLFYFYASRDSLRD